MAHDHRRSKTRSVTALLGAVFFVAALVGASLFATPASAQYGATTGVLDVAYEDGCYVWVEGGGFAPGATVAITLSNGSTNVRTTTADGSGWFSYLIILNTGDTKGNQTFAASGPNSGGGIHSLSTTVKVAPGCVQKEWWKKPKKNNGQPPSTQPGDDGDPPPSGPVLFTSKVGESAQAAQELVVSLGGFDPGIAPTPDNIRNVLAALPASPVEVDALPIRSTLPLAAFLSVVGVTTWFLSRELDVV